MKILTGGSNYNFNNEKDLRSSRPSNYTATISGFTDVYNILPGTVLFLGYYKGNATVYLAVSKHEMIRYMNLKTFNVWKGQDVTKGEFIGTIGNTPLQFEYCTVYKQESNYPVRFDSDITYYKQNPIDILDGVYWPYREEKVQKGIVRTNSPEYNFTSQQKHEWYSYMRKYQYPSTSGQQPDYWPKLKGQ